MQPISIFVCCHRQAEVPKNRILQPIQAGAALAPRHLDGFLHDDAGEQISAKNRSYCELTALYWAWKNCDSDHIGLFHYRRYLYPDRGARRPYRIENKPTEELLRRLGYDSFSELIAQYDIILPKAEQMYVSVREHYAGAPFHRAEDLALMESVLREREPDYVPASERYLSGSRHYFGNIMIMRRELLEDYCAWLFPLLEEFDRRADFEGRSPQELRVDGYLAERLLGIYVTKQAGERRVLELPRVHFDAMDGRPDLKKRLLYRLLPPGSRCRAAVKAAAGRLRGGQSRP